MKMKFKKTIDINTLIQGGKKILVKQTTLTDYPEKILVKQTTLADYPEFKEVTKFITTYKDPKRKRNEKP